VRNRTADLQRCGIGVCSIDDVRSTDSERHRAIDHWIDDSEEKRITTWREISDRLGSPVLTENAPYKNASMLRIQSYQGRVDFCG
jgi:hypothetical protein